jgi:hypothetical protein
VGVPRAQRSCRPTRRVTSFARTRDPTARSFAPLGGGKERRATPLSPASAPCAASALSRALLSPAPCATTGRDGRGIRETR